MNKWQDIQGKTQKNVKLSPSQKGHTTISFPKKKARHL